MKQIKKTLIFIIFSILIFSSCRNEFIIDEFDSNKTTLATDSPVTDLIKRTSLLDGSGDNIIDKANCITVELPVTVIANGVEILVDSKDKFRDIEIIFDEDEDDEDNLEIIFPIRIVLSNHTEFNINNQSELDSFRSECNGEDEDDDDIECIDFKYPIDITIFDTVTEQTTKAVINNDENLHSFIEHLDDDDVASIQFPIVLILVDETEMSINNIKELENFISDAQEEGCDEDDNYNFNDDDCEDCSQQDVLDAFASCGSWTVNKLRINNVNLQDNYIGYSFNFSSNGIVTVQEGGNTFVGTWSSSGNGKDMIIMINIPTLPDFNGNWNLHDVETNSNSSQEKIDLRIGENRLRFNTTC